MIIANLSLNYAWNTINWYNSEMSSDILLEERDKIRITYTYSSKTTTSFLLV